MSSSALSTLVICTGFFLILFGCTEEFQRLMVRLKVLLHQQPRFKYLAYSLGVLLFLSAAALIAHSLFEFCTALKFSYE